MRNIRVYDCFIFNDELDMLECRLTELDSFVDRFVIMEATTTHQGEPRGSSFLEDYARFSKWAHKIHHFVADVALDDDSAMGREGCQRNRLREALLISGARTEDLVLFGDVDEIPSRAVIHAVLQGGVQLPLVCAQRFFCFAADWEHPEAWLGTIACRLSHFLAGRPVDLRNKRELYMSVASGWHLSWLGGPKATASKLRQFAHPEIRDGVEGAVASGLLLRTGRHVDGQKLRPVTVDSTWPTYIRTRRCPESWFRPSTRPENEWEECWAKIDAIPGWLTENEARCLFDLARERCDADPEVGAQIVEVGSFFGRSSVALAMAIAHSKAPLLACIDTWKGIPGDPLFDSNTDVRATHVANMRALGLDAQRFDTGSVQAAAEFYNDSVSLLFIDGDHSYEACREDFEQWLPKLRRDAYVAFHDASAPGPKRVISELPLWFGAVAAVDDLVVYQRRP
jgi:predicted O-methyltransferase YrrM